MKKLAALCLFVSACSSTSHNDAASEGVGGSSSDAASGGGVGGSSSDAASGGDAASVECSGGVIVAGSCVFLTSLSTMDRAAAEQQCSAKGAALCESALVCTPLVFAYLTSSGCGCTDAGSCHCPNDAGSKGVYVHVADNADHPYVVNGVAGCGNGTCVPSTLIGSGCGLALCCR